MTAAGWGPRPRLGARYYKAHGLGNDYVVFEEGDEWPAEPQAVRSVCDRWVGVGGDGIVALLDPERGPPFAVRMFNPDGSEFERSGNGLRILASHLWRRSRVGEVPFEVEVGGERVTMTVHEVRDGRYDVSVYMGRAAVGGAAVGLAAGVLDDAGEAAGPKGEPLRIVPVRVGNPHVVVFGQPLDHATLGALGGFLSGHPGLRAGANVQLAEPDGGSSVRALVWERGVGHTSASGTSACAVAVASVVLGHVDPGHVSVHMEGGELAVTVTAELDVTLRGPVEEVCEGTLLPGLLLRSGEPAGG